jgi:hypothetical protein
MGLLLARIFFILLISIVLISGCVSPINQTNNLNQTISANTVIPTQTSIPLSIFLTGEQTANKIAQNIDYNNPIVKKYASTYITPSNRGNYNFKQVFDIWDSINNNWTWVAYPDDYSHYLNASDLITGGLRGNCLNLAVLTSASIEAIGGNSRIVKVSSPDSMNWHVYPELFIGNSANDAQIVTDYVTKRYSTKMAYWHEEVDSQGVTSYWLNLDYIPKTPGGYHFDDNGEYYVFYPNGNFNTFPDTGYLENFPHSSFYQTSSNLNEIPGGIPISYHSYTVLPFHGSPNKTISMEIIVNTGSLNSFIFDQENFSNFKPFLEGNITTSPLWWRTHYSNIEDRVFNFYPPVEGDYYLVIYNFPIYQYDADSKKSLNVTIIMATPQ